MWLSTQRLAEQARYREFRFGTLLIEYGLSPPTTFWTLAFRSADLVDPKDGEMVLERIFGTVMGLYLFMAAAVYLWILARARLRREKGPPPAVILR